MLVRFGNTFYILRSSVNPNLNLQILWYECFKSTHSGPSKYFDDMKTKPFKENDENIWVSPPHPKSNLRLKSFPYSEKMSEEEKNSINNMKKHKTGIRNIGKHIIMILKCQKAQYIEKVSKEKNLSKDESLTDEDMSHFYKDFLQKNYKKHVAYNWNWYKKNFNLLYLAAKVNVCKIKRIFKSESLK